MAKPLYKVGMFLKIGTPDGSFEYGEIRAVVHHGNGFDYIIEGGDQTPYEESRIITAYSQIAKRKPKQVKPNKKISRKKTRSFVREEDDNEEELPI